MAPSRGKIRSAARGANQSAGSSRRTARKSKDAVPEVYDDMLAEAAVTDPVEESSRPLKRRRVVRQVSIPNHDSNGTQGPSAADHGDSDAAGSTAHGLQTIEASPDDGDESDFAFEDVDLGTNTDLHPVSGDESGLADVSISINPTTTPRRRAPARRKPASAVEKAYRLLVHKSHVLCLLGHCIYVNSWCNNEVVQRSLQGLLPDKAQTFLHPKTSASQFDRSRAFIDGLQQASEAFRDSFTITASSMRKARWESEADDANKQYEVEPMDRSDFILAAKKLEGSQDTGNQLFCALLRSEGVEARLVCSLQALPFATSPAKSSTPQKPAKPAYFAIASDAEPDNSEASGTDTSIKSSSALRNIPSVRRRLGQPSLGTSPLPTSREKKRPVRKLAYPIFWVEAFNEAHQKWIAVDPIVTGTVNKPTKLEPPSSYAELNQMSYVIAFESDGVARDVTRRYAKAYNAKTRRHRVEATEGGTGWWKKALRIFRRRGGPLDRDQVEDTELAQKEAREGLPSNVQDFKDHPYYALERHLKRHEVIHPKREVGKVNAGTAAKPRMESVYRRQDVLMCRSGDKWYRLGREVRVGEQPVKHVVTRRSGRAKSPVEDGEDGEATTTTALYALHQTDPYVPPPVVQGRVPRNAYGNLDIYVPSMVPAGGTHIRHPLTQDAARLLRIDYADAVTGFSFKGRQGTAIIEGAIVATEHADAVHAALEGFEEERKEEAARQRSLQALVLWKKFLTGLRIAERVSGYGKAANGKKPATEVAGVEGAAAAMAASAILTEESLITAGLYSIQELTAAKGTPKKKRKVRGNEEDDDDGFESDGAEMTAPKRITRGRGRVVLDEEDEGDDGEDRTNEASPGEPDGGGGFIVDDTAIDDERGGGFVPEPAAEEVDYGGGFVAEDASADEYGGGFLAGDADDEGRGGFFAEDTEEDVSINRSEANRPLVDERESTVRIDGTASETVNHAVHGYHDAANDHRVNQIAEKDATVMELAGATDGGTRDADENKAAEDETPAREAHGDLKVGLHSESVVENMKAEEDESDHGSMLSHDPEDEDAEPDWMESD